MIMRSGHRRAGGIRRFVAFVAKVWGWPARQHHWLCLLQALESP